jgi:non-heme chloroperoxidase
MRREFEHEGRLISYLNAGSASGHQAGTLLFLHAFPMAAPMWEPQLAAVPSAWRFVAPDLRGFGRSAPDRL